jgi:uncharacterized protein
MQQLKRLLKVPIESFFLFDKGVFQALRPRGPLDRPEEIHGASVEGLVVQHLKAWIDDQQASS